MVRFWIASSVEIVIVLIIAIILRQSSLLASVSKVQFRATRRRTHARKWVLLWMYTYNESILGKVVRS